LIPEVSIRTLYVEVAPRDAAVRTPIRLIKMIRSIG